MTTNTTTASLLNFLVALSAKATAPFVSVVTLTSPELLTFRRGEKRTDENRCTVKSITRKAWGSFQLGSSYENRVNNAAAKVADSDDVPMFRADALWRGKGGKGPVPFTVSHIETGEVYLSCLPIRNGLPHKKADEWVVDGVLLEGEALESFKAAWLKDWRKAPSAKQAEVGLTDIGQQVNPRCYHIENVISVECGAMGWNEVDGAYGVQADVA
jgi:hypothetical protein